VVAGTRRLERLTASDLFMLLWDDYGWPNEIVGLAILDGTSLLDRDGRVRIEVVRQRLEPRLHLVPRFRQLLSRPRLGLGWPLWVDAPGFDLADHLRVHPLAAPGDHAQLLRACAELARRPLDRARPLWELWLLPGLPQRRVGAFIKVHHVVADGPAGVAAFGGPAGPDRRRAHPGGSAVAATPDPDHQDAAERQPAPAPPAARLRVVRPGPSGPDAAPGPIGLAGVAGSLHRAACPGTAPAHPHPGITSGPVIRSRRRGR
jgi:diacylglycerol O-acyltransferase / wax synthase